MHDQMIVYSHLKPY